MGKNVYLQVTTCVDRAFITIKVIVYHCLDRKQQITGNKDETRKFVNKFLEKQGDSAIEDSASNEKKKSIKRRRGRKEKKSKRSA